MKSGPNKKPTALKVLEGNPGKRPLPQNEPKPKPIAPECPEWLIGEGKKMWNRLSSEMERIGLLTVIDGEAFAAACQAWKIFVECQQYINNNGLTYEYENKGGAVNEIERPQVKIGQKSLDQFRAFCSEFGLSPAARTRIEVKPADNEIDPMEGMLSGVK
jgi:P27 family predicted phage terminase small subunit